MIQPATISADTVELVTDWFIDWVEGVYDDPTEYLEDGADAYTDWLASAQRIAKELNVDFLTVITEGVSGYKIERFAEMCDAEYWEEEEEEAVCPTCQK